MLLQPTTAKPSFNLQNHGHQNMCLSSNFSYSKSFPSGFCYSSMIKPITTRKNLVLTCSISQVHSYGTVDYEKRPTVKWNAVYKRIILMDDPKKGSASVLNQWENEGKKLTKWELSRVVKELRKFKRFNLALEVYEWMNNREERFRISTSDTAIQLDLISKVHGISSAEDYFLKLPDPLKDKRIYGALLNAYGRARKKEEAESLMDKMRDRGYACHALPFNVIMTLYMNLQEYDKVQSVISEMLEKNINLDIYSYNIWLSSCGAQGSVGDMEEVLERMKLDTTINPNWTTYSTMATLYIKLGEMEKAEDCLKKIESRITGRDRIPYHYLISLYGTVGKKEEVYRVWDLYKSIFSIIPNLGYHAVISSLIRVGDIEGAEKIYNEWLSVKSMYDPRVGNLLLACYVRNGFSDKAEAFFDEMIEVGGRANSVTWEILAEGHVRDRKISEALSCLKNAVSAEGSQGWRPKPVNVSSVLKLCEQEGDISSKEALMGVLRQAGCLDDETYMSFIPMSTGSFTGVEQAIDRDRTHDDDAGSEIVFSQLQESL
ncbi:pentatricopeptide repeat-containing protein At1g02150-like [Coffea arabica]|nr:pentatricopeptide repeat-containing protein At1g02150-like [Coffea arabica]